MKVLKALLEERDKKVTELDDLTTVVETEKRDLTPDEETRSITLVTEVDELDGRIVEEKGAEEKRRLITDARSLIVPANTDAAVVDEPRVYGPDSPHSHCLDLARRTYAAFGVTVDGGATERLSQWAHQVESEFASGSKIGKRAERQLREQVRELGPAPAREALEEFRSRGRVAQDLKTEQRTGSTTGGGTTASASGGGGAALVSPIIFLDDYAPYREYGRAFVDQCNKQDLPDWGMNVYIPAVTGGAEVTAQTEGEEVGEKVPTVGFLTGALGWEAGDEIITQQLLDRAGPNFSYDKMLFDQLQRNYAPKVDAYALKEVLSVCHSQSWAGEAGKFVLTPPAGSLPGSGGFYGQVSKAKAYTRTAAGTVMNATHAFYDPARWEFLAAWADANGRPVIVPDYAGPFNAIAAGSSDGDAGIEGATGYRFNGLPAFTDANIPKQGTTSRDQVIVGNLAEVYWFEGDPIMRAVPQTLAKNLQVLLQLYAYRTIIVRYPNGIVVITGTGLSEISYTD
jgi:hypothetical protein